MRQARSTTIEAKRQSFLISSHSSARRMRLAMYAMSRAIACRKSVGGVENFKIIYFNFGQSVVHILAHAQGFVSLQLQNAWRLVELPRHLRIGAPRAFHPQNLISI